MARRPIVTARRLKAEYGIPYSRQHIDRLVKAGKFPQKIQLGSRCTAFYCDEIESWISSRPVIGPDQEADESEADESEADESEADESEADESEADESEDAA
jgi:prophage regulatory protein